MVVRGPREEKREEAGGRVSGEAMRVTGRECGFGEPVEGYL